METLKKAYFLNFGRVSNYNFSALMYGLGERTDGAGLYYRDVFEQARGNL